MSAVMRNGSQILRDPQGQLVEVDPAKAAHLLAVGVGGKKFSTVSEQDVTKEDIAATNSTLGAQVETAGRGALEAVGGAVDLVKPIYSKPAIAGNEFAQQHGFDTGMKTEDLKRYFGQSMSGNIASAVSGAQGGTVEQNLAAGDEFNAQTRIMQRENPLSYGAGEFGANLVAGLATGGVTTAGGKLAANALARAGLGKVTAGAIGTGAAMAAEGAVFGAAGAESQASAAGQSDGATAEQLLQGMGLGAILGGGIGAAAGGTSALFRKIASRGESLAAPIEAEQRAVFVDAMKGTPESSAAVSLSSRLSGVKEEVLNKYGPHVNTPEAIEGRRAWVHRDEIIDAKVSPMSKDLQEMQDAFEPLTDIVRNPTLRKEFVETLPDAVKPQAARAGAKAINETISSAREILDTLPKNEYTKSSRAALQRFVDFGDSTYERALRGDTVSAADINAAANAVKQEAQRTVVSLGESAASGSAAGEAKRYARETAQVFESNAQEPLRLHLEDSKVWGVAGEGQAATNKAWVDLLSERGVLTRFQDELFGKGSKEYLSRRPYRYADTAKIKSWLESAGTTAGETRQAMVRDAIDGIDTLTSTIGKYHEMGPGQAAHLEKLQAAAQRMRTALADVDKTVVAANAIEEAAKAEKKGFGALAGGGLAAGAFIGGLPGAALGLGIGALLSPTRMMGARAALDSVASRFGTQISGGAHAWIMSASGIKKAAAGVAQRAGDVAKKAEKPARAAVPAAIAAFVGRDKDLESAYQTRMDQLIQAKNNPDQVIDRLGASTAGLADVAPGVAGELVAKAHGAIGFLAALAPSGTLDPTELQPGRKAVVPRAEMARFARVWGAVEKPMSVLEDLRRGIATPDQIAALKAVHPETYQAIRNSVNDAILEVARKGKRIPLATRQQLDLLLDLGGAGEPAFGPGISDRIAAAREQQQKQQKPKTGKVPNLTASAKLPQDNWT